MKIKLNSQRYAPAVLAFIFVLVGAMLALPSENNSVGAEDKVPVVVAKGTLAAGEHGDVVAASAKVLMVPEAARADGAFTSIEQLPNSVLAYGLVPGQQILRSSFSTDRVSSIGRDFVSVSLRVDPQRWVGPMKLSGAVVNIFDSSTDSTNLISIGAVILDSPSMKDLDPKQDCIISLAVKQENVASVVKAAANNNIWLVGT